MPSTIDAILRRSRMCTVLCNRIMRAQFKCKPLISMQHQSSSMLCEKHQYGSIWLTMAQCWLNKQQYGSMLCIRHHNYGSISLHHASVVIWLMLCMAQYYQASICGSMLCIRDQYGSIWLNSLHHASIWLSTVYHASKLWLNPMHHGSILCIHRSICCASGISVAQCFASGIDMALYMLCIRDYGSMLKSV